LRTKEEKVKRVITLIVLLALCLPVYAADKEDPQQYQVDVTIRFNSLSMAEFTEIQAVLDKLAKQSCKTTIELTKLEAVSWSAYSTISHRFTPPGGSYTESK